ncbi:6597_t:CDS:2, partial [Acaulospora colombiana]
VIDGATTHFSNIAVLSYAKSSTKLPFTSETSQYYRRSYHPLRNIAPLSTPAIATTHGYLMRDRRSYITVLPYARISTELPPTRKIQHRSVALRKVIDVASRTGQHRSVALHKVIDIATTHLREDIDGATTHSQDSTLCGIIDGPGNIAVLPHAGVALRKVIDVATTHLREDIDGATTHSQDSYCPWVIEGATTHFGQHRGVASYPTSDNVMVIDGEDSAYYETCFSNKINAPVDR